MNYHFKAKEELFIVHKQDLKLKLIVDFFAQNSHDLIYVENDADELASIICYLTHDPQRRCPNLTKAKEQLNYSPTVKLDEGVYRYLAYLKEEGERAVWYQGDGGPLRQGSGK